MARHVLRRHRDDEQRNADADDRRERERRHGEHGMRERNVKTRKIEQAERARHDDARDERRRNRITRHEALADEIDEEHHDDERAPMLGCPKNLDADLEQDARQQRGGDAGRDALHQRIEPAGEADRGQQRRADDERRRSRPDTRRSAATTPAAPRPASTTR